MIKYPLFIHDGSIIGITAPSDGANLDYLDYAKLNLKKFGFECVETESVRKSEYLVSNNAKIRAEELLELLFDKKISHIIAASGGEFLNDILPYIHENKNKIENLKEIKYIQGFSDVSLLNFYITTNYNIATINANNIGDFASKNLHESNKLTIDFLKGKYGKKLVQLSYEKYQELYTKDKRVGYDLNSDVVYKPLNCSENIKFEGRIIGGCIDVLTQIIGTKYDNTINFCNEYKNDGFIWYFDNAELSSMELYRRLYHIKEVEWLKNVKGILFGRRIADNIYKDFDYNVAIKKALGNLNVPIIYDVDIGHVMPQFTIINGSYATFELFNGKGKLTQELK